MTTDWLRSSGLVKLRKGPDDTSLGNAETESWLAVGLRIRIDWLLSKGSKCFSFSNDLERHFFVCLSWSGRLLISLKSVRSLVVGIEWSMACIAASTSCWRDAIRVSTWRSRSCWSSSKCFSRISCRSCSIRDQRNSWPLLRKWDVSNSYCCSEMSLACSSW